MKSYSELLQAQNWPNDTTSNLLQLANNYDFANINALLSYVLATHYYKRRRWGRYNDIAASKWLSNYLKQYKIDCKLIINSLKVQARLAGGAAGLLPFLMWRGIKSKSVLYVTRGSSRSVVAKSGGVNTFVASVQKDAIYNSAAFYKLLSSGCGRIIFKSYGRVGRQYSLGDSLMILALGYKLGYGNNKESAAHGHSCERRLASMAFENYKVGGGSDIHFHAGNNISCIHILGLAIKYNKEIILHDNGFNVEGYFVIGGKTYNFWDGLCKWLCSKKLYEGWKEAMLWMGDSNHSWQKLQRFSQANLKRSLNNERV